MSKVLRYKRLCKVFLGFALLVGFLVACGSDSGVGPKPEPEPTIPDHTIGDLVIDLPGGVKMAFMEIQPGTFTMGAIPRYGSEYPDEEPQHQVTLTKTFYLSKYEVTQAQWQSVMDTEPWRSSSSIVAAESVAIGDDFPATSMKWGEIRAFLSELNKLDPTATYRLPTETEWEYTCRAGTTTPFSFQESLRDQDFMWFDSNSTEIYDGRSVAHPHKVGLKKPNPWGLYDMHGNVAELVDYWDKQYTSEAQIDPQPISPPPPTYQGSGFYSDYPTFIARGGTYMSELNACRSASRTFWGGGVLGWLWELGRKEVGIRIVRQKK